MCRWMGSHFHDWIDYNGVTFLVELLVNYNGITHFQDFWDKKMVVSRDLDIGRFAVKKMACAVVSKFNSRLALKSIITT